MPNLTVTHEQLKATCKRLFMKAGVPDDEADLVSEVLVTTEGWGVRSHGVMRVEHYIRCLLARGIPPKAELTVESEGPTWAAFDGNGGLGIVVSHRATNKAIELARASGIGIVTVNRSNHFGAAGYYSMMCAEAGMFGMSMSNVGKIMAVTGSSAKSIGNNPFAYAAPAGKHKAVMLDICMSKVADGKVQIARDLGVPLSDGCIIDKHGRPSNDPLDYFNGGTLLPFGEYKGYGFAVLVEILAGVLSGGEIIKNVSAWNKDPNKTGTTGHCFIAMDVSKMMPFMQFEQRMERMVDEILSAPKADDVERILYPGQLEMENAVKSRASGITLLESCVTLLHKAAELVGDELDL
ncbi:MAG: (R)-2-hydroxyacid dehydrogenase [Paenibacillus sp.]|nr:(R)-2-hydroxyacid dehydrogenase [Paenibacillus sp.]